MEHRIERVMRKQGLSREEAVVNLSLAEKFCLEWSSK